LYDSGRRSLKERLYREAEDCLSEYLSREPKTPKSANRRARAHCLIALAILARTPPLSRSSAEIKQVVARLRNAVRQPLAHVLAALVKETFYEDDDWNIPEELESLAKKAAVDLLGLNEIELLDGHLPGMFGRTWEQIRRRAGVLGVADGPPPAIDDRTPDQWRRRGVPRYFAVIPSEADSPRYVLAWSLTGGAAALAVLPCAGLFVTTKWYIGVAVLVVMYCAGAALLFCGVLTLRECQYRQRLVNEREAAIAAAHPQPSQRQIDEWLRQDVGDAVRDGAARHRLDIASGLTSAGLVIAPQVFVGISKLPGPYSVERRVRDPKSPSGFRTTIEKAPLARSRVGTDMKLRASHYHILVIFLSERRLGVYECDVDLATRRRLAEATHSFSYDDVVMMSSRRLTSADGAEAANVLVDSEGRSKTIHGDNRFVLSLVNGHNIQVSTEVTKGANSNIASSVAWDNAHVQRSIERMVWALKDNRIA
jgi:hypothetical protein